MCLSCLISFSYDYLFMPISHTWLSSLSICLSICHFSSYLTYLCLSFTYLSYLFLFYLSLTSLYLFLFYRSLLTSPISLFLSSIFLSLISFSHFYHFILSIAHLSFSYLYHISHICHHSYFILVFFL